MRKCGAFGCVVALVLTGALLTPSISASPSPAPVVSSQTCLTQLHTSESSGVECAVLTSRNSNSFTVQQNQTTSTGGSFSGTDAHGPFSVDYGTAPTSGSGPFEWVTILDSGTPPPVVGTYPESVLYLDPASQKIVQLTHTEFQVEQVSQFGPSSSATGVETTSPGNASSQAVPAVGEGQYCVAGLSGPPVKTPYVTIYAFSQVVCNFSQAYLNNFYTTLERQPVLGNWSVCNNNYAGPHVGADLVVAVTCPYANYSSSQYPISGWSTAYNYEVQDLNTGQTYNDIQSNEPWQAEFYSAPNGHGYYPGQAVSTS